MNDKHPLMDDNITSMDIEILNKFLDPNNIPKLTNGPRVEEFENKWSKWVGTKYSVMVNSGSAANEVTMLALKYMLEDQPDAEVILPPLTWVSDIASVIFAGFKPVFCDINLSNFSFDIDSLKSKINKNTKIIFITHVLGINALTQELLDICKEKQIILIEDVCESHGTTFNNQKAGSFGFASNFSFYFAHHMSTIEGGMVCTNDEYLYNICRSFRSHGMVREMKNDHIKSKILTENIDLNPDFVFLRPAHNFRSTEINAVLGIAQLSRLDGNNEKRIENFNYFISKLNSNKFITDIDKKGQCSYSFIVVLRDKNKKLRNDIERTLKEHNIEFRRGLSGGGNQLRQPYFKKFYNINHNDFFNVEHVHEYGWYIGNYPTLDRNKIDKLIEILNNV